MTIEVKKIPMKDHWKANGIHYQQIYNSDLVYPFNSDIPIDKEGPWLAGGSARKLFFGKPLDTDIDLFFKDAVQFSLYEARLRSQTYKGEFIGRSTYASNFDIKGKRIQLINFEHYESIQKMFESFDFTICQFACDGENFYYTDDAVKDANDMLLKLIHINVPTATMRRIVKFVKQGFSIGNFEIGQFFAKIKNIDTNDLRYRLFDPEITWNGIITEEQIEEIFRSAGIDPKQIVFSTDSFDHSTLLKFNNKEDRNLFKLHATISYPDLKEMTYEL